MIMHCYSRSKDSVEKRNKKKEGNRGKQIHLELSLTLMRISMWVHSKYIF